MYAKGGEEGDEWRRSHRLVGAWQVANLIRAAARRGRHVIAVSVHRLERPKDTEISPFSAAISTRSQTLSL